MPSKALKDTLENTVKIEHRVRTMQQDLNDPTRCKMQNKIKSQKSWALKADRRGKSEKVCLKAGFESWFYEGHVEGSSRGEWWMATQLKGQNPMVVKWAGWWKKRIWEYKVCRCEASQRDKEWNEMTINECLDDDDENLTWFLSTPLILTPYTPQGMLI